MPIKERTRDRGLRNARALRNSIASELRNARLAAGLSQRHVARTTGLTQSMVSRTERNVRRDMALDEIAIISAALGLRLHVRAYPEGPAVRDAAQLRLLERLHAQLVDRFDWRTEVPVAHEGDLRAWDVVLGGAEPVGVDAETRLHDIQATQRRLELKLRDGRVRRVVLLVAGTRHNRDVLREYRDSLRSTLPLDTAEVLRSLRAGRAPPRNGIVLL